MCRAAFASRLFSTCTTRRRSAITGGRPSSRSTATPRPASPVRNVPRARSTRSAAALGSGDTDSVPESMRPASRRSAMSPRMWPACSAMRRWNSRRSAGSSPSASSSSVSADPLIDVSGARSSWPTSPRNSVRRRSVSSSGARSWMVTTIEPVRPPSAGHGVALTSTRTLRPSGTDTCTSSARTVSGCANCSASGASRPSARRTTATSSRSSTAPPGSRRLSTMRRASRFDDDSRPPPSNTTTPTGDVSISASRSCRARRSLACARALPIAVAACAANSSSASSSARVNAAPPAFSPRYR